MSGWYCYTCDQLSVPHQGPNPVCSTCGGSFIVQLEFPNTRVRVPHQPPPPPGFLGGMYNFMTGTISQLIGPPGFLGWMYNFMTGTISQLINTYFINQTIRSLSMSDSRSGWSNHIDNHTWIIPNNEVYHNHGNIEDHHTTYNVDVGPGEDVGTSNDDDQRHGGSGGSPTPLSRALIDSLPKIKVSRNDTRLNPRCTICMERFEVGTRAKRLPCKHIFHPGCIDPWLATRVNTCPICRQEVARNRQEVTMVRRIPYEVHTCPHHGRRCWWRFGSNRH